MPRRFCANHHPPWSCSPLSRCTGIAADSPVALWGTASSAMAPPLRANRRLPPPAEGGPWQCPMPGVDATLPALARGRVVEAAGIEPASRDAPSWASTRVVRRLMSSAPLRRTGSALTSSTVSRRGWAEQPPHDQPAVLRLGPPQARGPQRHYLVLRQRGSSACWHLVCSSRIYEVPGPRRATQVESASGRSRSPPCRADLIDERRRRGKGRVESSRLARTHSGSGQPASIHVRIAATNSACGKGTGARPGPGFQPHSTSGSLVT